MNPRGRWLGLNLSIIINKKASWKKLLRKITILYNKLIPDKNPKKSSKTI